ncbi:SAGA-associated factor 29 [Fistulifera solaris]|uniref:SAGA-associated factor 29 n=1 Tax=Fistulifera solaris TaxID=1519565 RepID=A0A1Z5KGC0_FISSO|nr:SAGA-associated factor 29 [Fistulifera solaris]|eukprot:GAX25018.1 SAGA-associated factor 29 [Fistulifera solaris]
MSSGDETYLESFVESLTTLPYQVRRNLELVQDLDRSYQSDLAKLQELYTAYLQQAEEKVLQLEVAPMETGKGVRVIRKEDAEKAPIIIPTTAELMAYTYDADAMRQIEALQADCLQKADEKVCVARQAYEWIDAVVERLDDDLQALSKILQAQGEFQQEEVAQPNDLAACQLGTEWILAKVLEFDTKTRTYKLVDEDVESHKVFHLPEDQVVILRGVDRLSKGDTVFAVYPDTTSFYQATVVQVPRKTAGQSSPFVIVSFMDDSDEFGVTHDKTVQLQHIMVPPK